jgi:hypothetical protein
MTAQPSPEFRRHHDVTAPQVDSTAFRQGWRVVTRLDQLRADGAIDAATYDAAIAVRTDCEVAFGRSRSTPLMALPGGGGHIAKHDRQLARVEAVGRLRRLAHRLGAFDATLIDQCVVLDLSWPEIGRRLGGIHHQTARAYAIQALRRLASEATRRGGGSPLR